MSYDIFISYKNDSSGNIFAERLANLKSMTKMQCRSF